MYILITIDCLVGWIVDLLNYLFMTIIMMMMVVISNLRNKEKPKQSENNYHIDGLNETNIMNK